MDADELFVATFYNHFLFFPFLFSPFHFSSSSTGCEMERKGEASYLTSSKESNHRQLERELERKRLFTRKESGLKRDFSFSFDGSIAIARVKLRKATEAETRKSAEKKGPRKGREERDKNLCCIELRTVLRMREKKLFGNF